MSQGSNGGNGEGFQPPIVGGVDATRLRSFIERIEHLDGEIRGLNEDKAEVYKEAEANFDKAALKLVVRRRRKERGALESEDFLVAQYEHALGDGAAPAEVAPRHEEARACGLADGLAGLLDHAARWPAGEYGHADYELGWQKGQTLLADAYERGIPPPPPEARPRGRPRGRARARARAEA